MSSSVYIILFIPLAYLFYQLGAFFGPTSIVINTNKSPQLRGNSDTSSPLISDFDAGVEGSPSIITPFFSDDVADPSTIDGDAAGMLEDNISMPSCAQDVFLTLHKEVGGDDEHACKGLLIRDDIIVTSRECSKFKFTFDFPGFGVVEAKPHTSLTMKVDLRLRLGFLKAHSPSHFTFLDQRVHRTPMFLSKRSSDTVSTFAIEKGIHVAMTCGAQGQPIAHDLILDGEKVPLGQLANVVPDDILWEETDLDTAPMLEHKKHRWWTRPITLDEEMQTFRKLLKQYKGPRGSVSIPTAHDTFLRRVAGLGEAVDPRGHRGDIHCWDNYYTRYREEEPFSGLHFFDWLDFGNGKFILEKNDINRTLHYMEGDDYCYKNRFNRKTVHYFTDEERISHEIYIKPSEDGTELIARYRHNNELVPESDMDDPHLYMWDLNETLYLVDNTWDKEKYGTIKHTGLLAGMPALSAGKAYFGKNGAIWGINYSSGHYRPELQACVMMYNWMKKQDFNLTALNWVGRTSWSPQDCQLWEPHWETENKIRGYDAAELNQSCYEVTTSPTWMLKDDV